MFLQFLSVLLLIQTFMFIWFIASLISKRNDIADLAWGVGFSIVSIYLFLDGGGSFDHLAVITLLTIIWASRLALHIGRRLLKTKEDSRYAAWRQEWGKNFILRSYLQVFVLQGLFMFLICFSAIIASLSRDVSIFTPTVILGILVWVVGFTMESVSDKQLAEFIHNPANKGRIMKSGLWKYSRHPNYFGEVTQWWGIFIITSFLPWGYLAIVSPLTITLLILFVSGVPLLEKKYAGRSEFEEYKKQTSVFIPWFPKKNT